MTKFLRSKYLFHLAPVVWLYVTVIEHGTIIEIIYCEV